MSSESRTRFNNEWPAGFLFPTEQALKLRLARHNVISIFFPAQLKHSDDHYFQTLLSHCIDALDHLPLRPDLAFDQVWKALDAEYFALKRRLGMDQHAPRFKVFSQHVSSAELTAKSHFLLAQHVPLQTCEFLAKRILDSTAHPNEHSERFIKSLSGAIGKTLVSDLHAKYDTPWLTPGQQAATQRKLGGFLKKLIQGEAMTVGNNTYCLTNEQSALLLIGTILPQFRNERFHGATRPPFRSSKATLKTYAHAYFAFIYTYALVLEVFLYNQFNVLSQQDAMDATAANRDRFLLVLGDQLSA